MKQTAVEWLFKQISTSKYFYKLMEDINSRSTVAQSNIFDQAKAMEKEQIVDAFGDGDMDTLKLGKEYYNYLYNKQ